MIHQHERLADRYGWQGVFVYRGEEMGVIFKNGIMYGGVSPNMASFSVGTLTLDSEDWVSGTGEYTQTVTLTVSVDSDSKVDLQPDSTAIAQMIEDGTVGLYAVNTNGVVTIHAIGEVPSEDLTVQYTVFDQIELGEGDAY